MNHFLARLGRSNFGKYFMQGLTVAGSGGVMAYHSYGHDTVEKLFGASRPDGSPMRICDNLRNLIKEVYKGALEAGFHKSEMDFKYMTFPDPPIRWFAAATVDPFIVGMGDLATGVTIGVPSSYNYEKPEDLPDSFFEVKKIPFFKSLRLTDHQKQEIEQKELNKDAMLLREQNNNPAVTLFRFDRQSDQGKEYADALILSEDAKRYSLAKELFIADTWMPLGRVGIFFASMITASTVGAAYVEYFKLKTAHVTQRLPGYMLAGLLGICLYYYGNISFDFYLEDTAHKRALGLGDNYKQGSDEYYNKRAIRNKFLRIKDNYFYRPQEEKN